jgi:prepilin-type N-terminal cleavage/methylation domain-containing protein/prepilin-type processing-associated H-X9-DG protein
MQNKTSRAGFTLIELLVVITIIAILAGLILPSLFQSQQKAWQAGCKANMRNISTALHAWIQDHRGWLPPGQSSSFGLWCNQIANYNTGDKYHMSYYLSSYLGCPPATSKNQFVPQFMCPSFRRFGKNYDMVGRVVYARTTGFNWGSSAFDPFGYPDSAKPPQKLESVAAILPLTSVWVLVDTDQQAFGSTWGEPGGLPELPSHGDQRNYFYFDGHVAAKKVPADGKL